MIIFETGISRKRRNGKQHFRICQPARRSGKSLVRLLLDRQGGNALPAALITLAVGSLLLTPFLIFVSSRALGTRSAETTIASQYSADAGIEYGIWSLLNDAVFRAQVDNNPSIAQPLAFPGSLNNYTPTISITGLPLGSWTVREPALGDFGSGASLAYTGGDRIYALYGKNSQSFGYYSIAGDEWFALADTLGTVRQGGSLVYGGDNYLYALRGKNSKSFWLYDISTDSWSTLPNTPENVVQGGDLVWNGSDLIFAFRGNKKDFWSYSIAGDSWSVQTAAPENVGFGSDLIFTGGNNIFAFRGRNKPDFWYFNISTDSWSILQNAPANISDGGGLAYYSGGYIYAFGGKSTLFWRYTIATDSWSVLNNTPGEVGPGGDLLFTQATSGYGIRGGNNPDTWEFEVTPPRYDIHAEAGSVITEVRVEINGLNSSIIFWDIE